MMKARLHQEQFALFQELQQLPYREPCDGTLNLAQCLGQSFDQNGPLVQKEMLPSSDTLAPARTPGLVTNCSTRQPQDQSAAKTARQQATKHSIPNPATSPQAVQPGEV